MGALALATAASLPSRAVLGITGGCPPRGKQHQPGQRRRGVEVLSLPAV